MKKIYLSLLALAMGSVAIGQIGVELPTRMLDKTTSTIDGNRISKFTSNRLQQKTVIFTEDFESVTAPALPAGITSSSNVAAGHPGWYTGNEIDANTGGFWPVPNNGSSLFVMTNDDTYDDFLCDEMLILPSQDLSSYSNVVIGFDVFHDQGYGSGDAIVRVSTDGGTNFTDVYTIPVDAAIWQSLVVDLSAYDGESDVIVAFYWNDGGDCTPALDNWGTGLAIDNIEIFEAPADELAGNWILPADISADYEYTQIPLVQAQSRQIGSTMSIANNGTNAQTDAGYNYDISFGGSSVNSGSSAVIPLASFTSDTVSAISTYSPSATGVYTIEGTTTMSATDANPANNVRTTSFEVTDFVWARDNGVPDGSFANIANNQGGGIRLGHVLFATADQEFNTVQIGIANNAAHDGQIVFAQLWYFDGGSGAWTIIAETDDHIIDNATEGGTIIELCFIFPAQVTAGQELLLVAGHYGSVGGTNDVRVMTAGTTRQGTVLGFQDDDTPFQLISPPAPMVRLSAGPCSASVQEEVANITVGQNFPNPFNGNTTVNYELNSTESVMVEITDITGKVIAVMNEGVRTAGSHVLTINSNNLAAGTYYYTLSTSKGKVTKAMTVAK